MAVAVTTCQYCKKAFMTHKDLQKHQLRSSACISFQEMKWLFETLDSYKNDDIHTLVDQNRVLEREINRLKNIVDHSRTRQEGLESTIDFLRALSSKTKKQLDDANEATSKLKLQINQLHEVIHGQYIESEQTLNDYRNELAKKQEEINELYANLSQNKNAQCVWNNIHIKSASLSKKAKNTIKQNIRLTSDLDTIKLMIEEKNLEVLSIHSIDNDLFIDIKSDHDLCQICFEGQRQKQSICKCCKECNICRVCEERLVRQNKPCPFCQTNYE